MDHPDLAVRSAGWWRLGQAAR